MPILVSELPTPMPTQQIQPRCSHAIPVNVLCYHVVIIHALPAHHGARCVLYMDLRKAAHVGISLGHVIGRCVVVGIWGLLCRRTTILLLPVPRADGAVALDARGGLDGRLVLLVLVIVLGVGGVSRLAVRIDRSVLPAHELPVQFLAPAESVPKADGSSVVAKDLRRQASGLRHAVLEDDTANTGVDERHRAHDARFVGEEDLQPQAEIAIRLEVVTLEVLLFEVVERIVEEEGVVGRLVETKSGGSESLFALVCSAAGRLRGAAQTLAADHTNGTHDSVTHGVALAWVVACVLASDIRRVWHGLEARVSSGGNNLCLVLNSLNNHAAGSSLRESLIVSLFTGSLGQVKSIGNAKVANERMLKVALGLGDGARVRAKGVGLAIEGGPVFLRPLLSLLGLGGRLTRDGGLFDLEWECPGVGVGAERRVLDHEVVQVRQGDQVSRADQQVQGEGLLVDAALLGWVGPLPAVSLGVLEHSLRSGVVPGALNTVHLFDEVTLADDVVGHVARAGEAAKVLQVDGILTGYVVFDYSVTK